MAGLQATPAGPAQSCVINRPGKLNELVRHVSRSLEG